MHEVKAFIRPEVLDRVVRQLHAIQGLPGLTVSHVRGHGRRQSGAADVEFGEVQMVKLEIVVGDELLVQVLDTIRQVAASGRSGDGKIFVLPVESALRIRSGEVGSSAL